MRKISCKMLAVMAFMLLSLPVSAETKGRVLVAYVASWTSERLPDPFQQTHINFAFGHVSNTFNSVEIYNPAFLRKVVALRDVNPDLKIMLSVGGWESGNFSEMADNDQLRQAFAKDCKRVVDEYKLDGIDIDWEYPTSKAAGISCSPRDTENFTKLMRDIRAAIGQDKLLTIATIAYAKYINFRDCIQYLDFVNIMAYDVANPPKHHTTLYRSELSGSITCEEAVDAHIAAGVPKEKLCLGMALYGRGDSAHKAWLDFGERRWDPVGKVPYLVDKEGKLVWAYDNPASLTHKCEFIKQKGLLGGMYWECSEDNVDGDGQRTIYLNLMKFPE